MTRLTIRAWLIIFGLAVMAASAGCERAAEEGAANGVRDGVGNAIEALIDAMLTQTVEEI